MTRSALACALILACAPDRAAVATTEVCHTQEFVAAATDGCREHCDVGVAFVSASVTADCAMRVDCGCVLPNLGVAKVRKM